MHRCRVVAKDFWAQATPADWQFVGEYVWPNKGVPLRRLKGYAIASLAYNWGYADGGYEGEDMGSVD